MTNAYPTPQAPHRPWAHVTKDPRNQWLANALARRREFIARAEARRWVIQYVRGGLDPQYATPQARDAYVQGLLHHYDPAQAAVMAAVFLQGWVTHRRQENRP